MKTITASRLVPIPEGVEVTLKARTVIVEGPRGKLERNYSHQSVEITKVEKGEESFIKVEKWHGLKKELACIRSICSSISNMFTGVTKGYRYKMRLVYAHFPINAVINGNKEVEIRNFLGQKKVFRVNMRADTTIEKGTAVKDQLILEGNDIDAVSQSAAEIQCKCKVRNKDIRKFLDGVYVSEKGPIEDEE
ncbi:60S ribosomal protein L9 [Hondaea fermentalgiana]|uniref:60S ribosomal protein L9 n=1 Tax=Hondaea fermentalgiana TaxID=2315210 RepID=A0A2R5GP02_9STRA|nr:60S ribosomal protein L9 [Hondaea fermentalgiana]|eukprot:GBG32610.1 60S ribosomal protein L9 [Hondaea fermentalgiana]